MGPNGLFSIKIRTDILGSSKKKKSHIGFFPVGKAKWKPLKLPPTSDQEGNSKPIWHLQGKGEGDGRD